MRNIFNWFKVRKAKDIKEEEKQDILNSIRLAIKQAILEDSEGFIDIASGHNKGYLCFRAAKYLGSPVDTQEEGVLSWIFSTTNDKRYLCLVINYNKDTGVAILSSGRKAVKTSTVTPEDLKEIIYDNK